MGRILLHYLYEQIIHNLLSPAFRLVLAPIVFTVFYWISRFLLCWLELSISYAEAISFHMVESFWTFLGAKPCQTFRIQDSAVVIVGAGDGVGQNITMRLSELGYTVFAICPNRVGNITPNVTRKSSNVTSLLHTWHHLKERSPQLSWGLIAPIPLDTSSKPDRTHAYETVQAYCNHHSLKLVALINLPFPCEKGTEQRMSYSGAPNDTAYANPRSQELLPPSFTEDMLRDVVARELVEPILMTRDYVRMLGNCTGKVIMFSSCPESSFVAGSGFVTFLRGARRAICSSLWSELEPLGIKVVSIVSGPVMTAPAIAKLLESWDLDSRNICSDQNILRVFESRVRKALRLAFHTCSVREEEIFFVIQRVIESTHPKFENVIGVHPVITSVLSLFPSVVQWFIWQFVYEA